jgi:hypothetical protein
MAIPPAGSHPLDRRSNAAATPSSARAADDAAKVLDWNKVMMDQDRAQARASLRPDTAAAIRAAQNVWLNSQEKPITAKRSPDAEGDIEAFITMLVNQASSAKKGL